MKNIDKIRAMNAEKLAKWKFLNPCATCVYAVNEGEICQNGGRDIMHGCPSGIKQWLNKEISPMPEIKIGDVLEVIYDDGAFYGGLCVAKGIVYITPLDICKETTEVEIVNISRWNAGSMEEIWRADNG